MKCSIIILLFISFLSLISAQSTKFSFGFELSPNFTNIDRNSLYTTFYYPDYGFRPAFNMDVKAGYELSQRVVVTGGVGYMTTREFIILDLNGQSNIDRIESDRFHSYVFLPLGVKYYLGDFFLSPELGIGWNTANVTENTFRHSDGSISSSKGDDINNLYDVNEISYPVFFSFGNEIHLKKYSISLGVKAYYSLNPVGNDDSNYGHYYGIGILAGMIF
jgi:hypothetical protein